MIKKQQQQKTTRLVPAGFLIILSSGERIILITKHAILVLQSSPSASLAEISHQHNKFADDKRRIEYGQPNYDSIRDSGQGAGRQCSS